MHRKTNQLPIFFLVSFFLNTQFFPICVKILETPQKDQYTFYKWSMLLININFLFGCNFCISKMDFFIDLFLKIYIIF